MKISCGRVSLYLLLFLFGLVALADAQASRTSKKTSSRPATPTNGSPTTFTLDVDQMYCDESLPYSYKSTRDTLELTVGSLQNTSINHKGWGDVLSSDWGAFVNASTSPRPFFHPNDKPTSSPPPPGSPAYIRTHSPDFSDPTFPSGLTGAWDESPTNDGYLNDSGGAILFDPTWDLSTSTYDAQRLLVRTVFGPNPFQVACAYPYLKYPDATPDSVKGLLHQGANGKKIPLLTKGAGYELSLNEQNAPKYYLINIVRWKDAEPPKGSPANIVIPFFQAASDDWYLLNYSDAQDRYQDIAKLFYKITPAMVSETLRIIGSDKVMFLGIHLAPLPVLGDKGIPNPNPNAAPATEQTWFDAVSLKYTFQASAATPTNMADLNTLLSIILGNLGLPSGAPAAGAALGGGPPPQPPSVGDMLTKLATAVREVNEKLDQEAGIDLFLRQLNTASYVAKRHYGIEPDKGVSALLIATQPGDPFSVRIRVDSGIEGQIGKLAGSDPVAIAAIQQDLNLIENLKSALASSNMVLSTYQGRYAAGLLTNLKNLPVTLASNWNATFTLPSGLQNWPGSAGVYDLTKPATGTDLSNRAGVKSSKSAAKSGNSPASPAKDSDTTATKSAGTAVGTGATPAANDGQAPSSADSSSGTSTDSDKDSPQSSSKPGKEATGKKSGEKKTEAAKDKKTTPTPKAGTTSNSSKNATATASTICTISLTKGSSTDRPPTDQHQSDCSDQPSKVLDEGRSRWDVSFIVPITGYKDLTFQAGTSGSTNLITAKTITRANAYGVFDLFLVPEDLLNPPYVGIPHIVVGLPFAGQVFNKPYFAVGESINFPKAIAKIPILSKIPVLSNLGQKDLPLFVRPVFGWVYNKVYPAGGAPTYRSLKPQWALEMSFTSIKDAVGTFGKKSSKGSGNTTKQTTPSDVPSTN
jgi:hypothetical protein